ncbi:hypothetical protein EUA93_18240 [Nocardioides oleivorans]|uniref:Uncharacterized protein n=1 Tax=Nocardioides oleivorans TaxID=273676 RepID=A0A4V1RKE9_9ACTN|nr:hypothetical protein [Nocardioides oleivorans]RYB92042.1 hypothetical protein EUA93_18240 [Nocardioides oleivorans]
MLHHEWVPMTRQVVTRARPADVVVEVSIFARVKAALVDAGLSRAAGPQATITLGELFAKYLENGRSPCAGRFWRRATRNQIEVRLERTAARVGGFWPLRCWCEGC